MPACVLQLIKAIKSLTTTWGMTTVVVLERPRCSHTTRVAQQTHRCTLFEVEVAQSRSHCTGTGAAPTELRVGSPGPIDPDRSASQRMALATRGRRRIVHAGLGGLSGAFSCVWGAQVRDVHAVRRGAAALGPRHDCVRCGCLDLA